MSAERDAAVELMMGRIRERVVKRIEATFPIPIRTADVAEMRAEETRELARIMCELAVDLSACNRCTMAVVNAKTSAEREAAFEALKGWECDIFRAPKP